MHKVKALLINVIILTVTSLIMRTLGVAFNVYLSNKLGASAMGLFQLISSVSFLAITFAISGIRLAATRLVSEELALSNLMGAKKSVYSCCLYSLFFSCVCGIILFCGAKYIGSVMLGDERSVLSLKIFAFSLPFTALASVMCGYFTAVRAVFKMASVQIAEQFIRIVTTIICIVFFAKKSIELCCASIIIGTCSGEIFSFCLLYLLYKSDIRKHQQGYSGSKNRSIVKRMFYIALPIAFGSYIRSAIRTLQEMLIPFGLKKNGASAESALSAYGTIAAMAMPVLMFPGAFLDAISDMLVPEMSEMNALSRRNGINHVIDRVFAIGLITSVLVSGIFWKYANTISVLIYKNNCCVYYFKMLSPLIPVLYMDMVTDSILKGLGAQISSMIYNITESVLSVSMLYFLLPKYGINGYLFTIIAVRSVNFLFSVNKLIKITEFKTDIAYIFKIVLSLIASLFIVNILSYILPLFKNISVLSFIINVVSVLLIYISLLFLSSCITRKDIIWIRSIFAAKKGFAQNN